MNRWAFLATQNAMVVAHLWTPVPDSDRLRPLCETRPWQVLPLNLAWPRRGFRKCKRCIPFESRNESTV